MTDYERERYQWWLDRWEEDGREITATMRNGLYRKILGFSLMRAQAEVKEQKAEVECFIASLNGIA